MIVDGKHYRTIWPVEDGWQIVIIDQTLLPFEFKEVRLESLEDAAHAIAEMLVRGAPLIGATTAYGVALAMHADPSNANLNHACEKLLKTRPTAVNLRWALREMQHVLSALPIGQREQAAYQRAAEICDDDVAICSAIGDNGHRLIADQWEKKNRQSPINILTHCNAGWLATVDWGTALAPIYKAHNAGIPVHVWVDETRPRNQGFNLTAWELAQHGVPHTMIVDNVGGHLMQRGQVDLCIVGTDRTTSTGDVCNKIGTYLKALAACDNDIPFYVALPGPTIDWDAKDGLQDIPIEQRASIEVTHMTGQMEDGRVRTLRIAPEGSAAENHAFDITPASLITGLITERGVTEASQAALAAMYPEKAEGQP
ncbi:MAG: S-methyl-5-thioribose-1-phosphate isomerase [Gammaproteobacteria bacterium]|nr:S-methyl-5-thioribose-1-phosphate isomerase [Gammaproteobacteria bacterium]